MLGTIIAPLHPLNCHETYTKWQYGEEENNPGFRMPSSDTYKLCDLNRSFLDLCLPCSKVQSLNPCPGDEAG